MKAQMSPSRTPAPAPATKSAGSTIAQVRARLPIALCLIEVDPWSGVAVWRFDTVAAASRMAARLSRVQCYDIVDVRTGAVVEHGVRVEPTDVAAIARTRTRLIAAACDAATSQPVAVTSNAVVTRAQHAQQHGLALVGAERYR